MDKIKGLCTGIGSLPHKDPDKALDVIFKYLPAIPFWPQLPKRDIREGMVAQFSENLACFKPGQAGLLFDDSRKEPELERFYERIIARDTEYFKLSRECAPGLYQFSQRLKKAGLNELSFIKGQITGPFTFSASIKDNSGKPLLHNKEFMQVIVNGLIMKAAWQIKFFSEFGRKIIIFVDEPYLGCFGSAYTPVNRSEVINGLTELACGIKEYGQALIGVHCCGNTDWSLFTDIEAIDIISFDAFEFQERLMLYADNLKNFFKRGGILCWGIVPTQEFSAKLTADLLMDRLSGGINSLIKKGLDKELVSNNLIISPSCGLGTLEIAQSEEIFKVLSQLSRMLIESL